LAGSTTGGSRQRLAGNGRAYRHYLAVVAFEQSSTQIRFKQRHPKRGDTASRRRWRRHQQQTRAGAQLYTCTGLA